MLVPTIQKTWAPTYHFPGYAPELNPDEFVGNNLEIYQEELALLGDWLKMNNRRLIEIKQFDRDPEAGIKRRYLKRYFPEYRTTVYAVSYTHLTLPTKRIV